jgi:hypothetical protein
VKRDLLLIDITKDIKAQRVKSLKALAARIGSSERFVRYSLKPVLILLGFLSEAQWNACLQGKRSTRKPSDP